MTGTCPGCSRVLARVPVLPVPGGGRHLQQPVHVADVADAVLSAVERPAAAGHCYDVAGPEPLSFAELLRVCARAVGSRTRFVPVPLAPAGRRRALLRAAQRPSPDPGRAAAAAGRGQGVRHRRRRSATSATRPGRSPTASWPRPARWDWPTGARMTGGDLALLARTAVHLRPGQVAQRARLRAQRTALRRFPPAAAGCWPARSGDGGGLAGRVQPARRAAVAELARASGPAGGPHRAARDDPDAGRPATAAGAGGLSDPGRRDWMPAHWARPTGRTPTGRRPTRRAVAVPPALLGLGLGAGRRAGPGRRPGLVRGAVAVLAGGGHGRPGRRLAALPGRAARLVVVRAAPGPGGGQRRSRTASLASLSAHAGFLRRHLETDVGGNHLIKNLKALAGLAVFFADDGLLDRALDRLTGQLAVQVLPDGGHYERAPAYHCQVLGRPDRRGRAAPGRGPGARAGADRGDPSGCAAGWAACSRPTGRSRC